MNIKPRLSVSKRVALRIPAIRRLFEKVLILEAEVASLRLEHAASVERERSLRADNEALKRTADDQLAEARQHLASVKAVSVAATQELEFCRLEADRFRIDRDRLEASNKESDRLLSIQREELAKTAAELDAQRRATLAETTVLQAERELLLGEFLMLVRERGAGNRGASNIEGLAGGTEALEE
jgi:hypothetical protein